MKENEIALLEWANHQLNSSKDPALLEMSALRQEASSRSYFRMTLGELTFVGVISLSDHEKNEEFVYFSELFLKNGVRVPRVLFKNLEKGFMLLEDFGDKIYQFELSRRNYQELYSAATDEIILIQNSPVGGVIESFSYEKALKQIKLFETWLLESFLDLKLNIEEKKILSEAYEIILESFFEQPQVLCHFDYESRNLMVLDDGCAGVLDFQDSLVGPMFLDPVALLKDVNHIWKEHELKELFDQYVNKAKISGLISNVPEADLIRWFDMAGLQRQLRILGVLCRLHIRDKKSYRMVDLEATISFIIRTALSYKELEDFGSFMERKVLPMIVKKVEELR
jgi:aminoglycoside/choline kinase family phosphotransferase